MALISIIVPVYNVSRFLDKCLNSIVHQTYEELEIILIDDGSTDGSSQMCDKWAQRDPRIVVIHSSNQGVSHARNIGLRQAKGDYIGFVDADDWIEYDMYEIMLQYMKKYHSDIHIGGYIIETDLGQRMELEYGKPQVFKREEALRQLIKVTPYGYPLFRGHLCDKLFKRKVLENLYLDEKLKLSEDNWLVWQAFRRATCISYVPQFGYHYYMRNDSATHITMKKENGTYLDSMKLILNDSYSCDHETMETVQTAFEIRVLDVLKEILISGNSDFLDTFKFGQNELRSKFENILLNKNISIRQKIGVFCLCLPIVLVKFLRPILIKQQRVRTDFKSKRDTEYAALCNYKKSKNKTIRL